MHMCMHMCMDMDMDMDMDMELRESLVRARTLGVTQQKQVLVHALSPLLILQHDPSSVSFILIRCARATI